MILQHHIMRKTLIITSLLLIIGTVAVLAQNSMPVKEKLARADGAAGARMEVVEVGEAGSIVRMLEASRKPSSVNGYRIRIFFDNSQTARTSASSTRARFEEMFPNIPVYLNYENPYFKVSVGNCLTIDEAIILWGQVKGAFDKAFVMREEIQLSALTKEKNVVITDEVQDNNAQ